jgi:hypothetical protein
VKNYLALWFAGGTAALLLILAAEWLAAASPPKLATTQVAHHDAKTGASADDTTEERDTAGWAEGITARPLFAIGRRPPKAEAGMHAIAATGLPRLAGIFISPAGRRAMFMPDGGKPLVVAEGGQLDDAKIIAIHADRVMVNSTSHGAQTLYLSFDHNKTIGGPTPPVFPNAGFNPTFPNPGFNPGVPGSPGAPIFRPQPQVIIPGADNSPANGAADDQDDSNDASPAQPVQNAVTPQLPHPVGPRGRE